MKNRNIALCIVFSFLTCGIYSIYWFYRLIVETKELVDAPFDMNPIVILLLGMVTCGIFWWVWLYKLGQKLDEKNGTNNAVKYLILAICCLSLVDFAFIQGEINKVTPAE